MLSSFIGRRPDMLLEADHPGKFLLYRFLSDSKGFDYLNSTDFIERELAAWGEKEYISFTEDLEVRRTNCVFCVLKAHVIACPDETSGSCYERHLQAKGLVGS